MTASGQVVRYVCTGVGGLAVSLGVTALMHEVAGLSVGASFAVALAVVFGLHFVANACFVFRSGADGYMFLRYIVAALAFRVLDFVLFTGIAEFAPLYVGVVLAVGISNAIKFVVYRRHVFVPAA